MRDPILAIKGGSSSIKFALFDSPENRLLLAGNIERIGTPGAVSTAKDAAGRTLPSFIDPASAPNHRSALERKSMKKTLPGIGICLVLAGCSLCKPGAPQEPPTKATNSNLQIEFSETIPEGLKHYSHLQLMGGPLSFGQQGTGLDLSLEALKKDLLYQENEPNIILTFSESLSHLSAEQMLKVLRAFDVKRADGRPVHVIIVQNQADRPAGTQPATKPRP